MLDYLNIDSDMDIDPSNYFDDRFLSESIQKSNLITTDLGKIVLGVLHKAKDILKSKKPIKVADLLTDYIQIFKPDDFILKKQFKIAKSLKITLGKWPSIYGNAVFFDSNYVLEDLVQMTSQNLIAALKRNDFDEK